MPTFAYMAAKGRAPMDANQNAKRVVDMATGEAAINSASSVGSEGVPGVRTRVSKLTPERRSEIARRAAAARWYRSE